LRIKQKTRLWAGLLKTNLWTLPSGSFNDSSLFNTACANAHFLFFPVYLGVDAPEIRQPAAPCLVMGVTDIVAGDRFFSAYFANFSHEVPFLRSLLIDRIYNIIKT
jgi:hypothetical protein